MHAPEARLRRASLQEVIERARATYTEWGTLLSLDQFQEREKRFRLSPWSQRALTTWFLEDSAGNCLSSCETFRAESRWRGRDGISSGIASVFTEQRLRGKGHARELLFQVQKTILASEPELQAQFLFSDIGAAYYEAMGYRRLEAWDRVFDAEEGDPFETAEPCSAGEALTGIRWPESPYLLAPSEGFLDWQLERERSYAEFLGRVRPSVQGARAGSSRLVWSVNYRKDELFALLLSAESGHDAEVLMSSGRRMARKLGLPHFRAWEERESFPWPGGGCRVARDGSLPMLRPATGAPELVAQDWAWVSRATWI